MLIDGKKIDTYFTKIIKDNKDNYILFNHFIYKGVFGVLKLSYNLKTAKFRFLYASFEGFKEVKLAASYKIRKTVDNETYQFQYIIQSDFELFKELIIEKTCNLKDVKNNFWSTLTEDDNKDVLYEIIKSAFLSGELYNHNELIKEHGSDIYNMAKVLVANIDINNTKKINKWNELDYTKIAQEFLSNYGIDFNIEELINDKKIEYIKNYGKETSNDGFACYDKENDSIDIKIREAKTITDMVVLVHELTHIYVDKNKNNEDSVSELFQEFLPYLYEFIFIDELINKKIHPIYCKKYLNNFLFSIGFGANKTFSVVHALSELENFDNILIKSDKETFTNDVLKVINIHREIMCPVYAIIGNYFALYYFSIYLESQDKVKCIKDLTNVLLTANKEEIFNYLKVDDKQETVKKVKKTITYLRGRI